MGKREEKLLDHLEGVNNWLDKNQRLPKFSLASQEQRDYVGNETPILGRSFLDRLRKGQVKTLEDSTVAQKIYEETQEKVKKYHQGFYYTTMEQWTKNLEEAKAILDKIAKNGVLLVKKNTYHEKTLSSGVCLLSFLEDLIEGEYDEWLTLNEENSYLASEIIKKVTTTPSLYYDLSTKRREVNLKEIDEYLASLPSIDELDLAYCLPTTKRKIGQLFNSIDLNLLSQDELEKYKTLANWLLHKEEILKKVSNQTLEGLMGVELTKGKTKIKGKIEALHRLVVDYHYCSIPPSQQNSLPPFIDGTKVYSLLVFLLRKKDFHFAEPVDDEDIRRITEIKNALRHYRQGQFGWERMLHLVKRMEELSSLTLLGQWASLNNGERNSLRELKKHSGFTDFSKEYIRSYLVDWLDLMVKSKYDLYMREYLSYIKENHISPQIKETSIQKIAYFSDGIKLNSFRRSLERGMLDQYFNQENEELKWLVFGYTVLLSNRREIDTNRFICILSSLVEKYQEKSLFYEEKDTLKSLVLMGETLEKRKLTIELFDLITSKYLLKTEDKKDVIHQKKLEKKEGIS